MNGAGKDTIFGLVINWAKRHPAALLAAIPATTAIVFIDSCTFPWCDELCLCDGMFMKALRGLEWSTVSAHIEFHHLRLRAMAAMQTHAA